MKKSLEFQVRRVRTSVRSDVSTGSRTMQQKWSKAYGDSSGIPGSNACVQSNGGAMVVGVATPTY